MTLLFFSTINRFKISFQLRPREKVAFDYGEKLKEKFENHPKVRRIARHRHVPKAVYAASQEHRIMKYSQKRKYVYM